jgi:hypothetical protein
MPYRTTLFECTRCHAVQCHVTLYASSAAVMHTHHGLSISGRSCRSAVSADAAVLRRSLLLIFACLACRMFAVRHHDCAFIHGIPHNAAAAASLHTIASVLARNCGVHCFGGAKWRSSITKGACQGIKHKKCLLDSHASTCAAPDCAADAAGTVSA